MLFLTTIAAKTCGRGRVHHFRRYGKIQNGALLYCEKCGSLAAYGRALEMILRGLEEIESERAGCDTAPPGSDPKLTH